MIRLLMIIWSRGLDCDEEWGRVAGENRNENVARILRVSLKDKKEMRSSEDIGSDMHWLLTIYWDTRFRSSGHVMRREDESSMKIIMTAEVCTNTRELTN